MSQRIALVEDDLAIRENYAAALKKQGYEVICYANRREACLLYTSPSPRD